MAFTQEWRLALAMSSILIPITLAGATMQKFMIKHQTASLGAIAKAGTIAEEVISSIRTAQAFGAQKPLAYLFDTHIAKAVKVGSNGANVHALGLAAMFFVIYSGYALAFFFGGRLVCLYVSCQARILTLLSRSTETGSTRARSSPSSCQSSSVVSVWPCWRLKWKPSVKLEVALPSCTKRLTGYPPSIREVRKAPDSKRSKGGLLSKMSSFITPRGRTCPFSRVSISSSLRERHAHLSEPVDQARVQVSTDGRGEKCVLTWRYSYRFNGKVLRPDRRHRETRWP